ncbi:hypothetical protein G6F70_000837 [Rhizopus microsporus]|nr:hypothetical protein G6F71_000553 [Rhizopus microsporus]KAG1204004.1 hypothetical protein G6F70_000837 [Rhizopus microsporus]KAG1208376.1 hypothetical protein G6F69_007270 [Rhizopus microsporus]KAG1229690.1 hypothetical protein G6F67_006974 [Rhizopus microsporus]KAG1261695.1 hypothetical protein G6F68_006501 [Rhizopus microsporus]
MSTTTKPTSATQKILRKLHLNNNKNANIDTEQTIVTADSQKKMKNTGLSAFLSNRRQEQDPQKPSRNDATSDRSKMSTSSQTAAFKMRQSRRSSVANSPQSPKKVESPAVMSDTMQTQILQEQLEKLVADQQIQNQKSVHDEKEEKTIKELKVEFALPSPPVTPAATGTPEPRMSEVEEEENDLATKTAQPPSTAASRRLRSATSHSGLRPIIINAHQFQQGKQRPLSFVDSCMDDYTTTRKPICDSSDTYSPISRKIANYRLHKRLSEHDLYSTDNTELFPLSLDEHLLLHQYIMQHHQQQQQQQQVDTDTSSESTQGGDIIKRIDSAKSIDSNVATDAKCEHLKKMLEKEKAIVRALQKQKEAINKDVTFLSQSVEELTAQNSELKKKLDHEKTMKERFQDDLSSTMDKLNDATEYIRKLENQNKDLKSTLEEKEKETRDLRRHSRSSIDAGKTSDKSLAVQLRHSQNQVRLLKSTMEQFLRMGVFSDDPNLSSTLSPTVSLDLVVPDFKVKQRQQRQAPSVNNKAPSKKISEVTGKTAKESETASAANQEKPEKKTNEATEKKNESNGSGADLDLQLRALQREKEILQAEYSKAPSSGGNAIVRRRREEIESRLDSIDSQICRIKLKIRSRQIT